MKKLMVTAAALTLGTSALAWAPAEQAHLDALSDGALTAAAWSDWSKDAWSAEKSPLAFSSSESKNAMKTESAGLETSASVTKSDTAVPEIFAKWQDPTVETSATASADTGKVETASWDGKAEAGSAVYTGMGGPVEEAQGYPTCRPGPGDDRCIQLYERGVTAELAAWKGSEPAVAMGGPYEPAVTGSKEQAASHSDHQSMNHGQSGTATGQSSGHNAADMGKPAATTSTDGSATKPATTGSTAGTTPGAIGGPIERQSSYPPCRPGRGDDRCIQLYERGVTGRDN